MGRKKKQKPDDPERSARFIEVAQRISDEEAGQRFEETMKRIAASRRKEQDSNLSNQAK